MTGDISELEGPWDLVVVGHGAAGLTAAAAFLDARAGELSRVAVLDRASVAERGGSTAWTTAFFRLDNDNQLNEDWGELVRDASGDEVNEAYIEAFYENAVDTLNWLRTKGVRVAKVGGASMPGIMSSRGVPAKYAYMAEGGGRAIVDTMTAEISARGAKCFYAVDLVDLERSGSGPVTGVRVRTADGSEHLMSAGQVVLACGGFEGNQQLLGEHIPGGEVLEPVSPGTRVNNGRGIDAAVAIGASRAGQYSGSHLEPVDPRCEHPEPLVSSWLWGILVDPDGERFIDEAQTTFDIQFDQVAKAVLVRGGRAFAISDAAVRAGAPMFDAMNFTSLGSVKADTIEDLASAIGVDPAALRNTVDAYNAASVDVPYDGSVLDGKHTEGIDPPKSHWAQPLLVPPFEAWPVKPQICFTFGGLAVDGQSHVLDRNGAPIPGLFAAGEITGIFHGGIYPSGTSVLRSLTFGRIAGQQAAESAVTTPAPVV